MGSFKLNEYRDDIISLLPDCLLHHVLSFLPTKEAVATCVLSKRWKHLWISVPTIDLDDSSLYSSRCDLWHPLDVSCFMNFVEKVLLARDTSSLKRFRLSCRVCFSATRISDWILAAIRHNVQELDLCLFVEEPFALPGCVFNNKLVTVMKIEMNCALHLPPRISFPCLRTLQLCLVTFTNDELMQSLFSACPFLEELVIVDCEWMNLKSVSITMPSLKTLIIDDLPFCSVDSFRGCMIRIEAGNLTFFKYSGYLSNEIHVNYLSSSAAALIHIPCLCGRQQKIAHRTLKLFGGLKMVSSLRISKDTIESLFVAENLINWLPVFENLTLLELRGEFREHSIELLIKFLQCSPKIEYLHLCEGFGSTGADSRLNMVPDCILPSLKIVHSENLHGNDTEIWFLKFLLKNAIALEKMTVFWSNGPCSDPMNQKEARNQLNSFPRSSNHCTLLFT